MKFLKILGNSLMFKVAASIAILIYLVARARHGGDFDVYLFEAAKLLNHENIYKGPVYKGMPYTYSVFWALLLIPFTFLPKFIPEFLWLLLNLFFIYRICKLITKWLQLENTDALKVRTIFFVGFLLTMRFLLYNFSMIQMTIFLMYCSLEGLQMINKKQFLYGALLLSLAINIKIIPLALIPYLIYRCQWKAAAYTVAFQIALLFVPAFFIGLEFNNLLIQDWWVAVNPMSKGRMIGESFSGTVGLNALVPVLLMDTVGELSYKRNFLNLNEDTVGSILSLSRLALIFFTFFFLRFPPFKQSRNSIYQLWEVSYIFCILPLLAPQQQKYAFFFIFPAVVYILYYLFTLKNSNQLNLHKNRIRLLLTLLCIFTLLTTITSDGFVGRDLNLIFQHYRAITYGGLVLVVILSLCNPDHVAEKNI